MEEVYWIAKVDERITDDDTGKIKSHKVEKLIKAYSATDVEAKVTKLYTGVSFDWDLYDVKKSKIDEVVE